MIVFSSFTEKISLESEDEGEVWLIGDGGMSASCTVGSTDYK